eukprot:s1432_g11.t1
MCNVKAGRPPSLVLIDEPLPRQVAEESTAYVLEDGQKVLKREENKSWRWNEVLVRSKEDILRSLLEPREERPSGLVPGFLEPKEDAASPPPPEPEKPKPAVQRAAAKAKDPRPAPVAPASAAPAPERAPEPRLAPEPRPERQQRRGAAPEVSERPERFNGASARRFRPSSSTRESLAMAVAERKRAMAMLEEHTPAAFAPRRHDRAETPAAPPDDEDAAELMVGGNVFRVRRLEQGTEASAPPSLQSMLAYLDAEDAGGYPPEPRSEEAAPVPKPHKAECPPGPAADWSMEEVSQYLQFLGLGHIEEKFKENAVDGAMLVELSEEDLCKELGLLKLQAKKLVSRLPRDNLPTAG